MIDVDLDLLYSWLNAFLWPFMRIAALLGTAPLFGESSTPIRLKVAYAALITFIVSPTLPELPAIAPSSYTGLLIALEQIVIGLTMGLVMRVVFGAVITAGEFIGLQMGLSFASFFDPATGANTAVLSRILNVVTMLLFLAFNGHLVLLSALVNTFHILPISLDIGLHDTGWGVLFEWSEQVLVSGMLLALPLIIILLTISLSMGILNRTAQQLSVFAVGFPVSLMTGLLLLAIVIPQSTPFLSRLFEDAYDTLGRMIYGFANG